MKSKLILIPIFVLLLAINHYWAEKSCLYCFQSFLAENYIFEDREIGFNSEYIENTIAISRHKTTNFVGGFVGLFLEPQYLNFLFWITISTLSVLFFYRKFFYFEAGIFAALAYLTNPTLPVTIHTIAYYFLALFFIYKFLIEKKIVYLVLFLLILLISFNVDISPSFVILITFLFLIFFYFVINKFKIDEKITISSLILLAVFVLIAIFESNFIFDLARRLPLFFEKILFYISSYPKTTYFYFYLISKIILVIIPIFYFYKFLFTKDEHTRKEIFIFSYFITIFPIAVLFILFDVSARIFDYYTPLLAAITFSKTKILFNKKVRKILIVIISLFLISFSIFLHYIPPRSLEVYNEKFIDGLSIIPEDAVVYTDIFVANALITKLNHVKVTGADFNRGDEYLKVYYEKDKKYIKDLFKNKNVEYFILSRQSAEIGLNILNAPHILNPINITEYDKMEFLERYYKNEEIYIWKVLE